MMPTEQADRIAALEEEVADLTKALTGLTCGGSEFFIRRGERFVADIPACVEWVRRSKQDAHRRTVDAALATREAKAALTALQARVGELEGGAADYIVSLTSIGAGEDPIGFLIASHAAVRAQRDEAQSAVTAWGRAVESLEAHMMDRAAPAIDPERDNLNPETPS